MKSLNQLSQIKRNLWSLTFCALAAVVLFMDPGAAMALSGGGSGGGMGGGGGTIGRVLCTVVDWIYGPVGTGIATLAIIIIGIGALMGKVSWGMAIIVGIGVAVIFGAGSIVNELNAGGAGC